ncbi:MAG: galactose oxidase-like domain-containing protein [Gemmatimonadales bacterium]
MPRSRRVRALASAGAIATAAALLLHGCGQEPTAPPATQAGLRYRLTVGAGSSTAGGTIAASHGGISCTVVGATSASEVIGACNGTYPAGTVVSLTATAASGAVLKLDEEWGATCRPNVEEHRVCQVTMDRAREVAATFVPASTSFTLSVSGGAGGSGTVYSTPSGISCTITGGRATGGNCSAGFARGTQVKLTARIPHGQRLKAWAGGGCDAATGAQEILAESCTTTLGRNVGVVVSFDPLAAATAAGTAGQWAAPISWPAVAINAVLLPNGKILTYGRNLHVPTLWNPSSPSTFTDLTRPADFFCSGHALLRDGRVLVTGGHSGRDNFGIKVAYIFDYRTNGWTRAADMRNGRWYPTSTTLPNGQVLTISGGDTAGVYNLIPEVYQPGTNTWRALTSASRVVPYYPMMFVAPDGRVYYAGPETATAFLNPTNKGSWSTGPTSNWGYRDYGTAVMYDAGKILLVGGGDTPTNTAERIDLTGGGTWSFVGSMAVARRQHNATLLADGKVLVTGGSNAVGFNTAPTTSAVLTAELWDPANPSQWKPLASMTHNRLYHSEALLLPDATVLSVGSGQPAATGQTDDFTAEIFSPPYLFKSDGTPASRPVISSAPTSVVYGQAFTVKTTSASSISKVTWIRLSAVTHSFNQGQRMNVLSFTKGTGQITVTAPANRNLAPQGHYMLFLVNSSGVPSKARIVKIN